MNKITLLWIRPLVLIFFLSFSLFINAAYTPPTALHMYWLENGGRDNTATCHRFGDYITNVTFAGINNSTSVGTVGWHFDYGRTTPQVAMGEVVPGQSYSISITVTSGDEFAFQYLAVYIDWNNDNDNGNYGGTLTLDANENPIKWFNYGSGIGAKTLTGTINVPAGTPAGPIYMRVMLDADSGGPNGGDYTASVGYGEIEDYVLNVAALSASAPTATTSAATSISSTGATLNGSVNANNAASVVTFEYGTSTSYGSLVTATQSPVTGTTATAVSAALTGLTPNTVYHYRVKAINTAGTTYGEDIIFVTNISTDIVQSISTSHINILPNPAKDFCIVDPGEKNTRLNVYNLNGALVLSRLIIGRTSVDISTLSPGVYLVRIDNETVKLVKY